LKKDTELPVNIKSNEPAETKISTSIETDNKPVEIMEDMNHLCAKAIRAQLLGNEIAYHEAFSKIEKKKSEIKDIIVTRFDNRGRPIPQSYGHQDRKGKRRKHDINNEDNISLKTIISQEKGEEIEDYNMDFINQITKNKQWMESGYDEENF